MLPLEGKTQPRRWPSSPSKGKGGPLPLLASPRSALILEENRTASVAATHHQRGGEATYIIVTPVAATTDKEGEAAIAVTGN